MATKPQRPNGQDGAPPSLNAAIGALNHAESVSSIALVKAVFGSSGVLLSAIRVGSLLPKSRWSIAG